MTNTERLIKNLEHANNLGYPTVFFRVGKYTGNGPSVVEALRRRGYEVVPSGGIGATGCYRLGHYFHGPKLPIA